MADEMRPRLGRGLAALIGEAGDEGNAIARARGQKKVPIEFLRANPRNPRTVFNEFDLDELTASIKEKGIIQPILARTVPGKADAYEIIAGERRWRAAQRAGLHEVPIILVEADDKQALELAIIENVQRADLNALEEAVGYERLGADFGYTQSDLARVIGKSRSHVANTMRLLKLPQHTKTLLGEGKLSAGHARALLALRDPNAVADRIVSQELTVRAVERLAQKEAAEAETPVTSRARKDPPKDVDTSALEKTLSDALGLKVEIKFKPLSASGELRISYSSLDQLDTVCAKLQA